MNVLLLYWLEQNYRCYKSIKVDARTMMSVAINLFILVTTIQSFKHSVVKEYFYECVITLLGETKLLCKRSIEADARTMMSVATKFSVLIPLQTVFQTV